MGHAALSKQNTITGNIMDKVYIALATFLTLAILMPFSFGKALLWFCKFLIYCIGSPYFIWRWKKNKVLKQRQQKNYDLLGKYVVLLGNNPEILKYLRKLIESGITEKDFHLVMQVNLENLKNFELEKEREIIRTRLEEEADFKKMAIEQQDLLVQSKLSMEQIKFREQLLDNLYKKMEKKYHL